MNFQLRQGMEPPSDSVSLEMNTLGSTRTSYNPATHDRPFISLECIECISPTVGISNRLPKGTASIDLRINGISLDRWLYILMGATHIAMLPARFLSFPGLWGLRFELSFRTSDHHSLWMPHRQIHRKSLIDSHKNTQIVRLKKFPFLQPTSYIWRNQRT